MPFKLSFSVLVGTVPLTPYYFIQSALPKSRIILYIPLLSLSELALIFFYSAVTSTSKSLNIYINLSTNPSYPENIYHTS